MTNSLFFSGAIKGHTDLINLFHMRKKGDFFFFFNSRRYYQCSHRQRQLTVGGWYWPAESHLKLIRERTISLEERQRKFKGHPRTSPGWPYARRVSRWDKPALLGSQGRPPCRSGEEGQGSARSDCLRPLTTAGTWTLANSTAVSA